MLSSAATAALRDIAHHIALAVRFAAGLDYEKFCDDLRTVLRRYALSRDHLRGFAPASRRAQGAIPDHRVEGNGRGEQRLPSRLRRRRSVLCMDDITEPFAAVARPDPTRTCRRRPTARRQAMSAFRFDPAELPP
jgi:hypothetical protein